MAHNQNQQIVPPADLSGGQLKSYVSENRDNSCHSIFNLEAKLKEIAANPIPIDHEKPSEVALITRKIRSNGLSLADLQISEIKALTQAIKANTEKKLNSELSRVRYSTVDNQMASFMREFDCSEYSYRGQKSALRSDSNIFNAEDEFAFAAIPRDEEFSPEKSILSDV